MTDQLKATPSDYYSTGDFGYKESLFISPIVMAEMMVLPEVWDQIGTHFLLSTFFYSTVGTIFFLVPGFAAGSVVTFSLYVHSIVVMLKNLEFDNSVNMKELLQLEAQGEDLWRYLIAFDISLGTSFATLVGISMIALWGKYIIGGGDAAVE